MRSGLHAGIRWSVCMLKSHRSLCESFSRTGAGLCIYHLFEWSNWNFLRISQRITLPTQGIFRSPSKRKKQFSLKIYLLHRILRRDVLLFRLLCIHICLLSFNALKFGNHHYRHHVAPSAQISLTLSEFITIALRTLPYRCVLSPLNFKLRKKKN